MALRCPGCNKFASAELEEPELDNDPELDDGGEVSASLTLSLISACCGEQMATAEVEFHVNMAGDIERFVEQQLLSLSPNVASAAREAQRDEILEGLEVEGDVEPVEETKGKRGLVVAFGAALTGGLSYKGEEVGTFSTKETVAPDEFEPVY